MREDLDPEIAHDALSEQAREDRLGVRANELRNQRGEVEQRRRPHHPQVPGGHGDVDDPPCEEWSDKMSPTSAKRNASAPARAAVRRLPEQTRMSRASEALRRLLLVNR